MQRAALAGRLRGLIEYVAEQTPAYRRVDLVGYSFGSLVALDCLFPQQGPPDPRYGLLRGLVTIGCPWDGARLLYPGFTRNRYARAGVPAGWLNVYAPLDVFGSNFRDDAELADATIAIARTPDGSEMTPINVAYHTVPDASGLGVMDVDHLHGHPRPQLLLGRPRGRRGHLLRDRGRRAVRGTIRSSPERPPGSASPSPISLRPPERLRGLGLDVGAAEPEVVQHVIAEAVQLPALTRPLVPGQHQLDARRSAGRARPAGRPAWPARVACEKPEDRRSTYESPSCSEGSRTLEIGALLHSGQRWFLMFCHERSSSGRAMSRRLPPLNALRAFEAAARHLSFTRAAAELHVTQTAISHQIRGLEERLGVRLFRRLPRGLLLTEEAQRYLPPVRDAFDRIAAATEQLAAGGAGGRLTVSVLPSFAAKWLVPRLGRFRAAHPDLDLRISASSQLVDFARDDVDVGIRMGRGGYPGLRVDRLFGESMVPVCSPALLSRCASAAPAGGPPPPRAAARRRPHRLAALAGARRGRGGRRRGAARSSPIRRWSCRRRPRARAWRWRAACSRRPTSPPAAWSSRSRSACRTTSPTTWSAPRRPPSSRGSGRSAPGCWRRPQPGRGRRARGLIERGRAPSLPASF